MCNVPSKHKLAEEMMCFTEMQDGVAPQTHCGNLLERQRAYIPKDWQPKSFTDCHSIGNYGWIFNLQPPALNSPNTNGYVRPR